ncbi:peptidoglycan DD-metalloendopeptidase family protein [Streptomyces sp. NPDC008121]|uniref:M23 family metallopeptidase n=1 Tax=Streptomyces sp. NPDC008121 TaxID=3364809 RepID=UPI0036EFBE28
MPLSNPFRMCAAFALAMVMAAGLSAPSAAGAPRGPAQDSVLTPVTASLVTRPAPFRALDGRIHFSYELLVTNVAVPSGTIRLERIEVTDSASGKAFYTLQGRKLAASANPVDRLSPGAEGKDNPSPAPPVLAGASQWIIWTDFALAPGLAAPGALQHRITGSFQAAAEDAAPAPFTALVAATPAARQAPVALEAPVRPGSWYANEACCDDTHHRRAALPAGGALLVPQRFAVDWFLLGPNRQLWNGDPGRLESYTSYRQPAVAAAGGTVVAARDGIADNPPMKPPASPAAEDSVGNHVIIQTGSGRYLLYAHLSRGSIKVSKGDKVEPGRLLALIGNSGYTFVPHLHFQVMTSSAILSDSTPYTFRDFDVTGRVRPRIWDDNIGQQKTGVLPVTPTPFDGPHRNEAPLDRYIIRFGSQP